MTDVEVALARYRVLPVLTVAGRSTGSGLGEVLLAGGLPLAEVTLRVDGALDALRAMASLDGLVVGAGTVLDRDQVERAVDAGARFVVSPGLHLPVVRRCVELGVPVFPGVATATEITAALDEGLDTLKLFPADLLGGPAAVAAYAAPFPGVRFVPTGGVRPDSVAAYLSQPAVIAVGGSWLAPRDLVAGRRWDDIGRLVQSTVTQINEIPEVHR